MADGAQGNNYPNWRNSLYFIQSGSLEESIILIIFSLFMCLGNGSYNITQSISSLLFNSLINPSKYDYEHSL